MQPPSFCDDRFVSMHLPQPRREAFRDARRVAFDTEGGPTLVAAGAPAPPIVCLLHLFPGQAACEARGVALFTELCPAGHTVLGRLPSCDVVVPEVYYDVSRLHATLVGHASGHVEIVDLGSLYGTTVNGRWLEAGRRHVLTSGDVVRLGAIYVFQVELAASPQKRRGE